MIATVQTAMLKRLIVSLMLLPLLASGAHAFDACDGKIEADEKANSPFFLKPGYIMSFVLLAEKGCGFEKTDLPALLASYSEKNGCAVGTQMHKIMVEAATGAQNDPSRVGAGDDNVAQAIASLGGCPVLIEDLKKTLSEYGTK